MEIRKTLYAYTGKDHLKTPIDGTLLEVSENVVRATLKASNISIDSIRPILTKAQEQLVRDLADYDIIDYFKDIEESQRADFAQLIWQGYVSLTGERKNYTYRLGKKSLKLIENDDSN